jgi:alanine racemase
VAEIDLASLRHNASTIAARVAPAGLMAVVKADAYGHGAVACARALSPSVWGFAVSLVEEGVELRRSGIEGPIVVLGGVYGRSHQDVVAYGLTPVVWELPEIERFARAADELAAGRVSIHVKVDTGMARLGVRAEGLPALLEGVKKIPGVTVAGLATHLADADGKDESPTVAQLDLFTKARAQAAAAGFGGVLTHVANTAGAVRFAGARYDLVRPGLALYGGLPSAEVGPLELRPVMRLKTKIVSLRDLASGERVSYGGHFRAARPTKIATIPIGYADGYTRRMSGKAEVLVDGKRCKVAGAITMDMAMVDVTDVAAKLGDEVVLIGRQGAGYISVDELAAWSDTVGYEIFCGISKRVPRVYVEGPRS